MTAPARFHQADAQRLLRAATAAARPNDTIRLTASPDGTLTVLLRPHADNDDPGPGTGWEDA